MNRIWKKSAFRLPQARNLALAFALGLSAPVVGAEPDPEYGIAKTVSYGW